jgi:hypothetical protein
VAGKGLGPTGTGYQGEAEFSSPSLVSVIQCNAQPYLLVGSLPL